MTLVDDDNYMVVLEGTADLKFYFVQGGTAHTKTLSTTSLGTLRLTSGKRNLFYMYYYSTGMKIYVADLDTLEPNDEILKYTIGTSTHLNVNKQFAADNLSMAGTNSLNYPRVYAYRN